MADSDVRVRIAPSPTGDPHVGTAYMALFNYAFARQQGGAFLLRIEDTDRARYVPGSEEQIFDTVRWLGLDWDEGPDVGGPYGPYRQSERLPIYRAVAEQLLEAGHAYRCWCTPERLSEMRLEQQREKRPPGYDRRCLGMTRDERSRLPGFTDRAVLRMLIPENPPLAFDDVIRGHTGAPVPDDQVILKADGFPTYHLGVVVDDHAMRISHVTRGEEWISSTPKHLLLYEWLGWDPPKFAHFPLLRNTDRSKISKRKNPAARLLWFREQGFLPEALVNFLALLGWSMPDEREIFSLQDLVDNFTWSRFSPVGPVFDLDKLDWLNHQYVQALPAEEFLDRIEPFVPGAAAERDALRTLTPAIQERTKRLVDVPEQVDYLFVGEVDVTPELIAKQGLKGEAAREALSLAEELVRTAEPYTVERLAEIFEQLRPALAERGWTDNPKKAWTGLLMGLRVAVTGKTATPPLFDVLVALGRERTLTRLRDAIDTLGPSVI